MTEFTPVSALTGGLIIGVASIFLMAGIGRIAGISGILFGAVSDGSGRSWRLAFLLGMLVAGLCWVLLSPVPMDITLQGGWPLMAVAGLLVGFGARTASGCTSGHAVCGIGRLSGRSIVATVVFMASAAVTVFITQNITTGG